MAVEAFKDLSKLFGIVSTGLEDWKRIEHATKGVGENVTDLLYQIKFGQRSFVEYVGQAVKLEKFPSLMMASQALNKRFIRELKEELEVKEDELAAVRAERNASEQQVGMLYKQIDYGQQVLQLHKQMEKVTGKRLSTEFLSLGVLKESFERSGQLNEALIAGNSEFFTRLNLSNEIWEAQVATGASMETITGASKTLSSVWPKLRTDFQSTLEVMVQMQDGLGVSLETSAQLARVWEINLNTPVREMADRIAVIANSTSLMADEAARYATEIGKALRLLGPGGAGQAKEVASYVTMMAGRMKDVGGDAEEVVKLFKELTGGSAQGFMLRGISGVTRPGALGTEAGAQRAMQGIGRMIDRIVRAAPGTAAYSAQLEAASQIMGVSTEAVRLYRDMLSQANKPLDEHANLQKRWQEQTASANQAIHRMTNAFVGLIQRGFGPVLPAISWFFGKVADFVNFIASHRLAVVATFVGLGVAAIKTTVAFALLARQLHRTALAAIETGVMQKGSGLLGGILGPSVGRLLGLMSGRGAVLLFSNPTGFAILVGLAIGGTLGTLFNHMWPKWAKSVGETLYGLGHERVAQITRQSQVPGALPYSQFVRDYRRVMAQEGVLAAGAYMQSHAYQVQGLIREQGTKAIIEDFIANSASNRESIALKSVTSAEAKTLDNDQTIIDQTKQVVANTGGALEFLKKTQVDASNAIISDQREKAQQILLLNMNSFMNTDVNMPRKFELTR